MHVAILTSILGLVVIHVSVAATKIIEDTVLVVGHSNHVVVGRHIIVVGWERILVFIVAVDNMIMHFLLDLQYVLRSGKDVLQVIKVQVFIMIGGLKSL